MKEKNLNITPTERDVSMKKNYRPTMRPDDITTFNLLNFGLLSFPFMNHRRHILLCDSYFAFEAGEVKVE